MINKTLIISAKVKAERKKRDSFGIECYSDEFTYNAMLYGQTSEHPQCVFFGFIEDYKTFVGYNDFIEVCKVKFCKYFETDGFNIVTLDNIIRI